MTKREREKIERDALTRLGTAICDLFAAGVQGLSVTSDAGKVNIQIWRRGGGESVLNGKRYKW